MNGARASRARTPVSPESVLDAVIEACDDAILTTDATARVVRWGAAAERLFGRTARTVVGQDLVALFPEHSRAEMRSAMDRVLAGEHMRRFETEVVRPDGMPVPLSMSLCPVRTHGSEPAGAVVVARDVTEERVAQATLAEVEKRLEDGEALAHVGSWLWDVRTGAVQWSTEFHRIHGIEPLEFDGTFESHLAAIDARDREQVKGEMQRSVTLGRPFSSEYRIARPDGGIRVVRVRAEPTLGAAGTTVGLRGIGRDVTATEPGRVTPSGRPGA
jgi:PAS domain S-box-containing protein